MKFLKIAFRHLLGHGTGNATNRTLRDDPWCCGEHSNIRVRRPRTQEIVERLGRGEKVALVTDAGSPGRQRSR